MEKQPAQSITPDTPQPSSSETPPIPNTKSISKPLIVILVLLFLAATGIAGYYVYQNYQPKKQTPQPQESLLPIATTSPSETTEVVTNKIGEEIIDVNLMVYADDTVTEESPISITTGRPTSPSIINQKKGDYSLKIGSENNQSLSETILWSCSFPIYFDYTGPVFEDVDYSEVKNDAVYVSYRIPYEPEMKSVQLWHKEKLIFFKRLPEN